MYPTSGRYVEARYVRSRWANPPIRKHQQFADGRRRCRQVMLLPEEVLISKIDADALQLMEAEEPFDLTL